MRWSGAYAIVNENIEAVMRDKGICVHDLAAGTGMSRTTFQWRLSRSST
jgi:hypothetical protein